jgi:nucleotide-binding universal stress UspA family protein
MKILLAVDGSECSSRAVQYVIRRSQARAGAEPFELHVLNVQNPLPGSVGMFLNGQDMREYHREEGIKCLQPARDLLGAAGVPHQVHIEVGRPADVIARYAEQHKADEVVMGTRGLGNVADMILGSTTEDVLKLTTVPLVLVK